LTSGKQKMKKNKFSKTADIKRKKIANKSADYGRVPYSEYPEDFKADMQMLFNNEEEYKAFVASYDEPPVYGLRANLLKGNEIKNIIESRFSDNESRMTERLKNGQEYADNKDHDDPEKKGLQPVPWGPGGYYIDRSLRPGIDPLHDAGAYYIQEPSAMAPAALLPIEDGDKVLDLCAAPGGKTTQAAAALNGSGLLVANEIVPERARILSQNIERMGIANAVATNNDPRDLAVCFPLFFDKVLADAPCSGEGMFRKDPGAVSEWSEENVQTCADRQDMILDCAYQMLKAGGALVYSTCTFAAEEDEGSVERFLARHPDMTPVPFEETSLGRFASLGLRPGKDQTGIRLMPHLVRGEGHFLALMIKGSMPDIPGYKPDVLCNMPDLPCNEPDVHANKPDVLYNNNKKRRSDRDRTGIHKVNPGSVIGFLREEIFRDTPVLTSGGLLPLDEDNIIIHGSSCFLKPRDFDDISGIKIIRPGLELVNIKNERLLPAHALSHALSPSCFRNVCELKTDAEAMSYIGGNTISSEGEPGFVLVTYCGLGLGFGKRTGSVIKNQYPKGLRRYI
jgi:NOL1/NOP2/sun family putative RNA methylase